MNYETQQFVPCDACGEEFPQHMVSNRFADSITCDACSYEIARDFEIVVPQELSGPELDDWASQYDDDPNPYSGTWSEM